MSADTDSTVRRARSESAAPTTRQMPSANRSARASIGSPTHCCGDMYANLPLMMPASVRVL